MNEIKIFEAVKYIDDSLISDAVSYKPNKRFVRIFKSSGVKIAVCFVVVLVMIICSTYFNTKNNSLPFSLKAYGESNDGNVQAVSVTLGDKIPIDVFETKSGMKGFVFSYDKPDKNTPSAVAVVSEGSVEGIEDEIFSLTDDMTQNYIFYVPDVEKTPPYKHIFIIGDYKSKSKYSCEIIIDKEGETYFAQLKTFKSDG